MTRIFVVFVNNMIWIIYAVVAVVYTFLSNIRVQDESEFERAFLFSRPWSFLSDITFFFFFFLFFFFCVFCLVHIHKSAYMRESASTNIWGSYAALCTVYSYGMKEMDRQKRISRLQ